MKHESSLLPCFVYLYRYLETETHATCSGSKSTELTDGEQAEDGDKYPHFTLRVLN